MDDTVKNLNFLHTYTIISANSSKNDYCIVETESNCPIESAFPHESLGNCDRNINSVEFQNVEKCDNQNSIEITCVDNINDDYFVQNPNEVFPFENSYCIKITEDICNTQTVNVKLESDQSNQKLPCQDLELLYLHKQVHHCDVCNRAFNKKSNLKRHYRSHTGDNPHVCNICDARYPTYSRLKEHQVSHSGERPHVCNLCNKTFTRISNLTRHLRTHNDEKAYKCDRCESCFIEATRLKEHYLTHMGEKKYSCHLCDKKFLKKYNLKRHYRIHTEECSHKCETCGQNFSKRIYLLVHIKTHSIEALTCGVQVFNHSYTEDVEGNQLNNSQSSVIETELPNKCVIKDVECVTSIENTSDNFETHTFKSLDEKLYSCKQCSRHFIKEKSLIAHLQKHQVLNKDLLQCPVCKTKFAHLSRLKEHFITHSGDKLFPCVICGRKFGRNSNLMRHLLTHTAEKKYQYDIYDKHFSNANRLNEHLLNHSGGRPHQCDACKKFFKHKFDLQQHYVIHTGEKLYKCDLCNKEFSRRSRLSYHYQSHGKKLPSSHSPSPLDNLFYIPNRVEPRLTQIIENLESRLNELSPKCKKPALTQKKCLAH